MTEGMGSASQAELVDGCVDRRLIVFGSVPPEGRDLDLLVPDASVQQLAATLSAAGFRSNQETWVRFAGCGVEAIDVVAASSWRLPAVEQERLFADAVPLGGRRHLARPGPAHELLILARRLGADPVPIAPRHRARIEAALEARPDAWEQAGARTRVWSARHGLAALRRAYETATPAPAATRMRARHEALRAAGHGAARANAATLRGALLPNKRRGTIVAISGLDGSGKTTQADALAATLRELHHDAGVQWSRITYDQSLQVIARPVKLALGRLPGSHGRAPPPLPGDPAPGPPRGPEDAAARALRARHPTLNQVWVGIVAGVHVWSLRRSLMGHLRRGRVVVRDRYVLDSAVELRQLYGARRGVGFAIGLVRRLSPPALVCFWLDVPAEVAYARKPEQFTADRLAARRTLYEAELEPVGAIRIDGTRPREEICAVIASETWRRLS